MISVALYLQISETKISYFYEISPANTNIPENRCYFLFEWYEAIMYIMGMFQFSEMAWKSQEVSSSCNPS